MTISTPEAPAPPLVPLVARLSPVSIGGMLLLAVLWGLSIPITKLGLDSTPPIAFTALRFSVAAPCLFLFALGRHRDRKSVVEGKSVSVRVDLGGCRILKTKNKEKVNNKAQYKVNI